MFNKKFVVALLIVSVLALATVTGLVITALSAEKINLFGGSVQNTDFSVTGIETDFKGKNKVEISLEITNNDVVEHNVSVTVELLNMNGDLLVEDTVFSGTVAGGNTYNYSHSFVVTDLVVSYNSTQIILKQLG